MSVDTTKVQNRRSVKFQSLDDILSDAQNLVSLHSQGRLRQLGNMSLGQEFGHLALWMHASVDGVPMDVPPAIKLFGRMFKGILLSKGLRPGFKLPPDAASKLIPPPSITAEDGFNQLSAACAKLRRETRRAPSPLLGKLTVEEWERLHLRHAELHLSFMEIL